MGDGRRHFELRGWCLGHQSEALDISRHHWGKLVGPETNWSYPGLVDKRILGDERLSGPPPLVGGGGEIPQRGMPAVGVGEPLDIVEQREPGGAPRREAVTSEQLAFEGREEALGRRIVEAIATTAHRTDEPSFAQPPSEGKTRVLTPLV